MERPTAWSVSVRDLAQFVWRRGDLRVGQGGPAPSFQQGAQGHRWLQSTRSASYAAEVSLSSTIECEGIALKVSGRADGVFTEPQPQVLEEIKTTTQNLLLIRSADQTIHWAQVKLYGAMYAMQHQLDALDLQLTYLDLRSQETRHFVERFSRSELVDFFDRTVSVYATWVRMVLDWRAKRDLVLGSLVFPYPYHRPGQRDLVEAVREAIGTGRRLFVQAPTGSGKTAAVLDGALRALVEQAAPQVVFLTAKTVGRLAAESALARIAEANAPLKVLSMSSRSAICPHPQDACTADQCPLAKGHYDRLPEAASSLFDRSTADHAAIEAVAKDHSVCPYWLERELVPWVDVVICDYNYLFDPSVTLSGVMDRQLSGRIVLIDEAHNLVDRSLEMYSAALYLTDVTRLKKQLTRDHRALQVSLEQIEGALESAAGKAGYQPVALGDPPAELIEALSAFSPLAERILAEQADAPIHRPLLELYFSVLKFQRAATRRDEQDITYAQRTKSDLRVKLLCLDPSKQIDEVLRVARVRPVFFSATLHPLPYFARVLGGAEGTSLRQFPSPFDPANRLVAVADQLSTRYRDRSRTADRLAGLIHAAAKGRRGNYIAYFPSYEYLDRIAERLRILAPTLELLVQSPGLTESNKHDFLSRFSSHPSHTLLGLAVMGGLFGEGIDLTGEQLIGAIVVSPGLPKLTFERKLMREYYDHRDGAGFEYAYVYPGMNKVVQAAGRVIRTTIDQGMILLIGERFGRRLYHQLLPDEWQPVHRIGSVEELTETLADFWRVRAGRKTKVKC